MAITPQDIEHMTFSEDKDHGYSTDEVDAFLDQLSVEVDAMLKKIADLKGRLTTAEQQLASSQAQVAELSNTPAASEGTSQVSSTLTASEKQISQVLILAQQSADNLIADAHKQAEEIRNEADQKAREVIRQALAEKQNELDEIDRLKQSQDAFRAAYKKMLQHFIDDADAVFPKHDGEKVDVSNLERKSASAPVDLSSTPASASALDFSDLD